MDVHHGTSNRYSQESMIPANSGYMLDARRRAALAEVDNAMFTPFHIKVCLVAGVGFFTDAYDIFAISLASEMLGYVYGTPQPSSTGLNELNAQQELGIKVATPVGTLVGQLLFGWLADRLGRKKMYGFELIIIIIATFAQAISGDALKVNIIAALVIWRFIMGVGIGGDYPLSAIISSEFASTQIRGRMMTAVFAAQGLGNFTAAFVGFIITSASKSAILADSVQELGSVDLMWRLLIGLGAVPGVVALYFRLTIPETPRFTMDIERNIDQATADIQAIVGRKKSDIDDSTDSTYSQRINAPKASWADFKEYFGRRENLKIIFATAYSWFAVDVAFYGLGLNNNDILEGIGFGTNTNSTVNTIGFNTRAINFGGNLNNTISGTTYTVYTNLHNIATGNLILAIALIPGYWVTFFLIDKWGRKPIQLMGFSVLAILFLIMGTAYDAMIATSGGKKVFVFLYCLANFFMNFGPNTTSFVYPGEIFPTRYRSTADGISAASGKLGAIITQVGFSKLKDIGGPNKWIGHIFEIFVLFMLTGVGSTLLLPETKNRSLEDLSNEKQEGFLNGHPLLTTSAEERS